MSESQRTRNSSATSESNLRPLVSASDVQRRELPTVQIPNERLSVIKEHGRERARSGANGTENNHVTGILGESAAAQFLGVKDRIDTSIYEYGDGGVDFTWKGQTIDVKTVGRHRSDPVLTVDTYQSLNADYYVLVDRIGPNECRLIGYAPRQFVANAPQLEYNGETYHYVPQTDLFPFPRHI